MGSALSPASVGIYALLQDLVVAGGVQEDRPQGGALPVVWIEFAEEKNVGGLGTGSLPELFLRTHVFSQAAGLSDAQGLNADVVGRLKDQAVEIAGYQQCGRIFWDTTIAIPDAELNGVKVHEIVSFFRIYAEAS